MAVQVLFYTFKNVKNMLQIFPCTGWVKYGISMFWTNFQNSFVFRILGIQNLRWTWKKKHNKFFLNSIFFKNCWKNVYSIVFQNFIKFFFLPKIRSKQKFWKFCPNHRYSRGRFLIWLAKNLLWVLCYIVLC